MKHLRVKIDKFEAQDTEILKNIDFILNQKDRISIVGGNGVGKTTLLKIMTAEIAEFDGAIENI
jgi:ATPase subunit of ABC transporter with duplicated ATPase domains